MVWPRCRSPWTRWATTGVGVCLGLVVESDQPRARGQQIGSRRDGDVEPPAHDADPLTERVGIPLLRRKRGPQIGVHLGGDHAQPLGLGREVAPGELGVQVTVAQQVADAGRGELPSLGAARQELLRERQDPAGPLDVTVRLRHVRRPRRGQRLVDLHVRVGTRLRAPEHLEDELGAVHQRGVALLDGERAPGLAEWERERADAVSP